MEVSTGSGSDRVAILAISTLYNQLRPGRYRSRYWPHCDPVATAPGTDLTATRSLPLPVL